ncbi:LemA family protein [Candidatus Sumerlaeota bacterium]|nr:LemA family protein [Candidatus Sumerlaeota bacterium]MBI3735242.1 LemA family protein [Candidatus Sumerlaeota bacterium]
MARNAWSDIDVQLKRRADLIPQLVETVKGYAGHEKNLLAEVANMRAKTAGAGMSVAARAEQENILSRRLTQLIAVVENYPELKASANFLRLQTDLREVEGTIADARRYYNAVVRDFNILRGSFPQGLIAGAFGFAPLEFFTLDDASDRATPEVRLPS